MLDVAVEKRATVRHGTSQPRYHVERCNRTFFPTDTCGKKVEHYHAAWAPVLPKIASAKV